MLPTSNKLCYDFQNKLCSQICYKLTTNFVKISVTNSLPNFDMTSVIIFILKSVTNSDMKLPKYVTKFKQTLSRFQNKVTSQICYEVQINFVTIFKINLLPKYVTKFKQTLSRFPNMLTYFPTPTCPIPCTDHTPLPWFPKPVPMYQHNRSLPPLAPLSPRGTNTFHKL